MRLKNLFYSEEETTNTKEKLDDSIFVQKEKNNYIAKPEEKNWAVIAHLSAFLGYFIPFGNLLGPFLIFYFKRDSSEFVKENARAAFNFQVSFTIYAMLGLMVYLTVIIFLIDAAPMLMFAFAFIPIILFYLIEFIFIVKGVKSASDGKIHKYPFTFNFMKKY